MALVSDLHFDIKTEIGTTIYIKKDGVPTESDISILDGKFVGKERSNALQSPQ